MGKAEKYTVEFLPSAFNDVTGMISSFVMLGSKQGAVRVKDKMNKAAEQLAAFPYFGVTVPEPKMSKMGFRMLIVEKYLMFYRISRRRKMSFFTAYLTAGLIIPRL